MVLCWVTERLLRMNGVLVIWHLTKIQIVQEEVQQSVPEFAGGVLQSSPRYVYLTRRLNVCYCCGSAREQAQQVDSSLS